MTHKSFPKIDWNVVVSVHEDGFKDARHVLGQYGTVVPTEFHNVLVMRVEDARAFVERFAARLADEPGLLNFVSRVLPATCVFDFQDAAEFDLRARACVLASLAQLAGKSFHVRMHRRGFKDRLSSHDVERSLGALLLEAAAAAGTPASLSFDDPDLIVAVETVGQRAGIGFWTRKDLQRFPFLHLD